MHAVGRTHPLFWLLLCTLSAQCFANTEPGKSLTYYHSGCYDGKQVSDPDCMAAMHRYCMYTHPERPIAFPQRIRTHTDGRGPTTYVDFLCMPATYYDDVPYGALPGCVVGSTGRVECLRAGRGYCTSIGHAGAGIAQEVTTKVAGLGCVQTNERFAVSVKRLQANDRLCYTQKWFHGTSVACTAAAWRICTVDRGYVGGFIDSEDPQGPVVNCVADALFVSSARGAKPVGLEGLGLGLVEQGENEEL